jgi:hypothetical protein
MRQQKNSRLLDEIAQCIHQKNVSIFLQIQIFQSLDPGKYGPATAKVRSIFPSSGKPRDHPPKPSPSLIRFRLGLTKNSKPETCAEVEILTKNMESIKYIVSIIILASLMSCLQAQSVPGTYQISGSCALFSRQKHVRTKKMHTNYLFLHEFRVYMQFESRHANLSTFFSFFPAAPCLSSFRQIQKVEF